MGVTGLWRLIEPAGKPVPVETLENKVLAVDISIWLHQMVKGYQDAKGAPLPNAHLMGLFQRLCKLLYFRIKPVFVFDGGFPDLKRETIAKRQDNKAKYNSESERLKRELALLLSKKTAVSSLLGKEISPKKNNVSDLNNDDIFKLPDLPPQIEESESESEDETSSGSTIDLHSVDLESQNFKALPIKEKFDLLIELKETRKMNSWGRLHELPKKSDNFSDFQMQRLLKRRKVQECLEETEKEMGDTGMSLNDLESLLNDEGIETKIESLPTRIASDNTTRILMINNVKKALADAKQRKEAAEKQKEVTVDPISEKKDELQEDLEKAIQISLECNNEANASACTSKTDDSWITTITDSDYSDYSDSEEHDGFEHTDMNSAKAYVMQYSDFTPKAIDDIVTSKTKGKNKPKVPTVDKIIEELNKEKSVIVDTVDLSSSDDDCIQADPLSDITPEIDNVNPNNALEHYSLDATQASVVCIEHPVSEIITLDTSIESTEDKKERPEPSKVDKETSDSSEEEFEEVPDNEELFKKPVVQVILKMDCAPDEDDIFADVFNNKTESKVTLSKVKEADSESIILDPDVTGVEKPKKTEKESVNILKKVLNKETNESTEISKMNKISDKNNIKQVITNDFVVRPSTSGIDKTSAQHLSDTNKPVQAHVQVEDEIDDDLEKAIKMSLECVDNITKADKKNDEDSGSNFEIAKIVEESQPEKIVLPPKEPLSTEQLNTMAEEIQNEEQDLLQEKGRLDRIGRNITEQMTKEAQELLQIFGIPYIVAPTEAEAQCAFLESVNLTDGTITDDSDIWLFGGKTVYKNFFNQKKHVLQFQAERIERSFNLTREQLVLLALLVGSDYTTGVTGVGPVTALEILASFPFNKKLILDENTKQARYAQIVAGLQEFKKWVRGGKRTDNTSLKKKLKNVDLNEDFPSVRVVQAYLEPNVEKSDEKFTWGELDITILRDYAKAKFGWSQNKLDEIIKPVIKRLQDRKNQRSVQDYFKKKIVFQSLEEQMSKRVKAAVQKMGPDGILEEQEDTAEKKKPVRKRKLSKKINTDEESRLNGPPKSKKPNQQGIDTATSHETEESIVLKNRGGAIVPQLLDAKSSSDIIIPKTDRFQEVIPQREKVKQGLLQNKLKAIEIFRKNKLDKTKKSRKRRINMPKEKAKLSESDSE